MLRVLFVHQTKIETSDEEDCESDDKANEYYDKCSLIQQIQNKAAIAATDATVKCGIMAGY